MNCTISELHDTFVQLQQRCSLYKVSIPDSYKNFTALTDEEYEIIKKIATEYPEHLIRLDNDLGRIVQLSLKLSQCDIVTDSYEYYLSKSSYKELEYIFTKIKPCKQFKQVYTTSEDLGIIMDSLQRGETYIQNLLEDEETLFELHCDKKHSINLKNYLNWCRNPNISKVDARIVHLDTTKTDSAEFLLKCNLIGNYSEIIAFGEVFYDFKRLAEEGRLNPIDYSFILKGNSPFILQLLLNEADYGKRYLDIISYDRFKVNYINAKGIFSLFRSKLVYRAKYSPEESEQFEISALYSLLVSISNESVVEEINTTLRSVKLSAHYYKLCLIYFGLALEYGISLESCTSALLAVKQASAQYIIELELPNLISQLALGNDVSVYYSLSLSKEEIYDMYIPETPDNIDCSLGIFHRLVKLNRETGNKFGICQPN